MHNRGDIVIECEGPPIHRASFVGGLIGLFAQFYSQRRTVDFFDFFELFDFFPPLSHVARFVHIVVWPNSLVTGLKLLPL